MPSTTRYHIEWTRIDRQKNKHILYPKNTLVDVYTSPTSGVSIKGKVSFMGTCATDAATAAKVVSIPGFALVTGAHLTIKFTNGITVASPTLNVNNTGAKAIKYKGSNLLANAIRANSFVNMVYEGGSFHVVAGQGGSYASKQTTKKFYLLGTPTDENGVPTSMYFDTGVYVDTVAGQLTAAKFKGNGALITDINADNISTGRLSRPLTSLTLFDGVVDRTVIQAYDDGDDINYGSEITIGGAGNTFIGSGESATNLRNYYFGGGEKIGAEVWSRTAESMYISADSDMYLFTNIQTMAERKGIKINRALEIIPIQDGIGALGTSSYKFSSAYINNIYGTQHGVHDGTTVLPRVEKDVIGTNHGANRYKFEEFKNTSANLPTAQWYHVLSAMGSSTTYETRLAIGMSDDVLAFRRKQSGTWQPWREVAHTGNRDKIIWEYLKPKTDDLYKTNVAISGTELQMTVPYVISVT